MAAKHNPGDNLLIGGIKLALKSAGRPLKLEHIAARVKHTKDRTAAALEGLLNDGVVERVEDGRWTI